MAEPRWIELSCHVVSPPAFLSVEGTSEQPSGVQVVDVRLHKPEIIECVCFKNHYTHSMTIKSRSSESRQWRVCVRDLVLMPYCHCDPGGEKWVGLTGEQHFSHKLENVEVLRFILRQPSPNWREFGVREVQCFRKAGAGEPSVDGSNELSEKLHCMLSLTTTGSHATRCSTGSTDTFDYLTDPQRPPYEVNLLSYT